MNKTFFLLLLFLTIKCFEVSGEKDTVLLRSIEATKSVLNSNPPSLNAYLESLPTHFANYLNQTGKYAVIELSSIFEESNLDLELNLSTVFEEVDKKLLKKPKYILKCSVTAFVEKNLKVRNPLDNSIKINRDIFVSATMQLINRENAADQKTFQVPDFSDSWDENEYTQKDGTDLIRIKKIEAFAKKSAEDMAKNFVSFFEQKIYVYERIGDQCTILAGHTNGVQVGQTYEVGITKKIIHPVTKKEMKGTTFTKIGIIKVISTQADVATCQIIEDFGINTNVESDKLPIARISEK